MGRFLTEEQAQEVAAIADRRGVAFSGYRLPNWGLMSPDGRRVVVDELLRRAECEISYSAKRAIELYLPVWEKGPAWNLFLKCAQAYALCAGEIEKCRALMTEAGMTHDKMED